MLQFLEQKGVMFVEWINVIKQKSQHLFRHILFLVEFVTKPLERQSK